MPLLMIIKFYYFFILLINQILIILLLFNQLNEIIHIIYEKWKNNNIFKIMYFYNQNFNI